MPTRPGGKPHQVQEDASGGGPFLHAGAYWLMWGLRVSMPKRSMWRVAQFDTLRLRLIKIAARVVEMKTMIRVHLPSSCPAQDVRDGTDWPSPWCRTCSSSPWSAPSAARHVLAVFGVQRHRLGLGLHLSARNQRPVNRANPADLERVAQMTPLAAIGAIGGMPKAVLNVPQGFPMASRLCPTRWGAASTDRLFR